jgi:tripartite ATP-independent transporter DctP family solute receptor
MKRLISFLLVTVFLAATLAGCSTQTTTEEKKPEEKKEEAAAPIELKLAVESAVGTPGDVSAQDFKRLVEEKTNGRVIISYFPAGQVGTGDDLTELMQSGSMDMSWRAIEWYSKFEPGWNILLMGFMFKDNAQLTNFLKSDKHKEFKDNLLKNSGLRMIADNGIGAPRVLISKKPVNSPEDMKGMNMRVPGIEMYMKTWQGVGVNCVSVPWGDAYMALSQGTVDALESLLGSIYGMKFHEVGKYITLTNHVFSPYVMVINDKAYNKLSPELQEILTECAMEAGDLFTKYDSESVNKNKDEMIKSGVTINENPDIKAFQEKLAGVAEECENSGMWPKGLYEYVLKLN